MAVIVVTGALEMPSQIINVLLSSTFEGKKDHGALSNVNLLRLLQNQQQDERKEGGQ